MNQAFNSKDINNYMSTGLASNQANYFSRDLEENTDIQAMECLNQSEASCLGSENSNYEILEDEFFYRIKISKMKATTIYSFSSCKLNIFFISTDSQQAAVTFMHGMKRILVTFNPAELSTTKVFQKLTAAGFSVCCRRSREIMLCFENFISQKLIHAQVAPYIGQGFYRMTDSTWRFCYKTNHHEISPFHNVNWDTAQLETNMRINLKASYDTINHYLCTLTNSTYTQSFLFVLFAYLPLHSFLKVNGYELDKTIHFIGNTFISENIMNNFLKVFNKGGKQKFRLSVTPSEMKSNLENCTNDIQPFFYSGNCTEWDKYRLQNYQRLLSVNTDFNSNPYSSMPMVCNLPLYQTSIERAIIIDTSFFTEPNNYPAMIQYFNRFALSWIHFIEKEQKDLLNSFTIEPTFTGPSEGRQAAKCIYKVMELLQAFISLHGLDTGNRLIENCNKFLELQTDYEQTSNINEHIEKYFREFFENKERYRPYSECAKNSIDILEHQIFYSEDYIAISNESLSQIISPLINGGVKKQSIMECFITKKLLHKPKQDSYCSTAYITDLFGNVEKKTLVQFHHALLDWLKLDINLFGKDSIK